jgi:hypothetical protein
VCVHRTIKKLWVYCYFSFLSLPNSLVSKLGCLRSTSSKTQFKHHPLWISFPRIIAQTLLCFTVHQRRGSQTGSLWGIYLRMWFQLCVTKL